MKIRIGIVGYGNLGRGVECAVRSNDDMELVAFFTRRKPESVKTRTNIPVFSIEKAFEMKDKIDVMILCGGSAKDLPEQTPLFAKSFNVIDSFDTHAKIPEHFERVDKVCKENQKTAMISVGWDPGLFSVNRLFGQAVLPDAKDYTFWGKGVSQGHSDAIRRIEGVLDARQYTIPVESAIDSVRRGENPELNTRQKHTRECYVVAKEGADLEFIEKSIVNMPDYFADYDTTVHFITQEQMNLEHSQLPHGGVVLRSGVTGFDKEHKQVIEYKLSLDSNPEFTASVIVAYARAVYRLNKENVTGCMTVFDVAPKYLHKEPVYELYKKLL